MCVKEVRPHACGKLNSSGCSVYVQLGGNIPPPFFPFHKIFLCFLDKKGKECTHTVCKISRWNIQYRTAQPGSVVVFPPYLLYSMKFRGFGEGKQAHIN